MSEQTIPVEIQVQVSGNWEDNLSDDERNVMKLPGFAADISSFITNYPNFWPNSRSDLAADVSPLHTLVRQRSH